MPNHRPRILPLIADAGNRRLLTEWVVEHDEYERVALSESLAAVEFDLCILDKRSFRQHLEELRSIKESAAPVLIPYLLLLPESDERMIDLDRGGVADNVVVATVDEIVSLPVKQVELEWRIKALLRLREQSLILSKRERDLQRFKQAVEATSHAVYITDPDGTIEYVNPAFEAVTGFSAEETIGKTPRLLNSGEQDEAYYRELWNKVLAGESWEEEVTNRQKSGETYVADQSIAPITADDGSVEAIVAVQADITDRKELEKELTAERQFAEQVFETSPIAKTVLDTEGRVIRANRRAEDVMGRSKADIVGRQYDEPAWNILEPGEEVGAEGKMLPFDRVLATGEAVYGDEIALERPDGEEIWLSVNMAPITDSKGAVEYLVTAMEDITERKRLERELRQSEELHRVTLSNITDTVFIADDRGQLTYVCPNAHYIFGRTADEVRDIGTVSGVLGDELVAPGDLEPDEVVQNIEHEVTDAQGEIHMVLVTVKAVSIQGGTRLYSVRDITERKRRERQFRTFVEHSSDIITVIDESGIIQYESPSIERVLGYDSDVLVGTNAFDIVHPDDRERVASAFLSLKNETGEDTVTVEYRVRHADGSWRWGESIAAARSDPDSSRFVINSRDITERVEAERELRETDESRSLALWAANAGIWEWNLRTDELVWHESCERLFGVEPGTFEGTVEAFLERVHSDDRLDVDQALHEAAARNTRLHTTFRIVMVDGTTRWIDARGRIRADNDDERMFGVNVDITEKQERIRQLQVLDRVLRHNLHNDMNVIRGHAETIRDEETGPAADRAELIVTESNRLLMTVDKERQITEVLSTDPKLDRIDLVPTIRQTVDDARERHPTAVIEVELPDRLKANTSVNIDTAIAELLENAIIHNDRATPNVSIKARTDDDAVHLRIADDGPGIPEMEYNVVIGEHDIEPLYHGSGLGLWLAMWIVRRSNGTIEIEGNDPRGTVASITLPRNSNEDDD